MVPGTFHQLLYPYQSKNPTYKKRGVRGSCETLSTLGVKIAFPKFNIYGLPNLLGRDEIIVTLPLVRTARKECKSRQKDSGVASIKKKGTLLNTEHHNNMLALQASGKLKAAMTKYFSLTVGIYLVFFVDTVFAQPDSKCRFATKNVCVGNCYCHIPSTIWCNANTGATTFCFSSCKHYIMLVSFGRIHQLSR